MLSVQVDAAKGIAVVEPQGALSKADFELAAQAIDPHIEKSGKLNGIVVHVREFPGWDSFGALASHLKFVRAHHTKLKRIAACTDSPIGGLAQAIANHFVSAEIRAFKYAEFEQAKAWVAGEAKS